MRGSFWGKDSLITSILLELQPIMIFREFWESPSMYVFPSLLVYLHMFSKKVNVVKSLEDRLLSVTLERL